MCKLVTRSWGECKGNGCGELVIVAMPVSPLGRSLSTMPKCTVKMVPYSLYPFLHSMGRYWYFIEFYYNTWFGCKIFLRACSLCETKFSVFISNWNNNNHSFGIMDDAFLLVTCMTSWMTWRHCLSFTNEVIAITGEWRIGKTKERK